MNPQQMMATHLAAVNQLRRWLAPALLLALLLALAGSWGYSHYQARQQQQQYLLQLEQLLQLSLIPLDEQHQQRQRQFRRDAAMLLEQAASQPTLLPLLPWSRQLVEKIDQQLSDSAMLLSQLQHWSSLAASELLASGELGHVAAQLGSAGRFYADYPQHQQALIGDISHRLTQSTLTDSHSRALAGLWQRAMSTNLEADRPAATVLSRVLLASSALFAFIADHRQQLQQLKQSGDPAERQQLASELRQQLATFHQALAGWQQLQQGRPAAPMTALP